MSLDDLDTVMSIEVLSYEIPWSRGVMTDCITGANECNLFLLDGSIIGYSVESIVVDETHVLNICINPSYSGRGFGRIFLRKLIERAIARDSSVVYLEVRVSNERAIYLYSSEGFNEVGLRPNYYPAKNGKEDALLMTLDLKFDHYV